MPHTRLRFALVLLFLSLAGSAFAQQAPAAASPHADHHAPAQAKPSADKIWADLMAGNARFVAGKPRAYSLIPLRSKLESGQSPDVIVLSCSDSRVSPELVFDQSLGHLFVIRTAGNIADPVALGSMEYAAAHFHSPVLVVLGHQQCGAVKSACSGEKMPSSNLEAIMKKIDPAVAEARTHASGDQLLDAAVKQNVHQSAQDVIANSAILRDAVKSGQMTVVEAEYQFDTGAVVRLGGNN